MNTDFAWTIGLEISLFLVELLLRERNFGCTHTQITRKMARSGIVHFDILYKHSNSCALPVIELI